MRPSSICYCSSLKLCVFLRHWVKKERRRVETHLHHWITMKQLSGDRGEVGRNVFLAANVGIKIWQT